MFVFLSKLSINTEHSQQKSMIHFPHRSLTDRAFTIPNTQRIAKFACTSPKQVLLLTYVNATFQETMKEFHTINLLVHRICRDPSCSLQKASSTKNKVMWPENLASTSQELQYFNNFLIFLQPFVRSCEFIWLVRELLLVRNYKTPQEQKDDEGYIRFIDIISSYFQCRTKKLAFLDCLLES